MSRHRDVRSMRYSDEYDGYDDVYGHSVEDDYCVSPSAEQFMFDRNKQANIASFFNEPDIKEASEEDEEEHLPTPKKPELSEIDTAKLVSCVEVIRNVIGDTVSEADLTDKIIKAGFNAEVALDEILKATPQRSEFAAAMAKDRQDSQTGSSPGSSLRFTNPLASKPNFSLTPTKSFHNPFARNSPPTFGSPKTPGTKSESPKFSSLSDLIANHSKTANGSETSNLKVEKKPFGTLADLTSNHLQKSSPAGRASNFLIPKFSLKTNDEGRSSNLLIPPLKLKKDVDNGTNNMEIEHNITVIQKELVQVQISPKLSLTKSENNFKNNFKLNLNNSTNNLANNSTTDLANCLKTNSESNFTTNLNKDLKNGLKNGLKADLVDNSENIGENEAANEFSIDLTKALKQTRDLTLNESKKSEQLSKYDIKDIYIMTAQPLPSSMMECLDNLKHCEFDLSPLRKIKLTHANPSVSLFGKMLCRKWKPRKPYVKTETKSYGPLKPFDFNSPSPDNLILANLRRN